MKEIIKKLESGDLTRRQLEIIIEVMKEKYSEFFMQSITRIAMAGNIQAELYNCNDEKEKEKLKAKRDAILQEERERREEYDHAAYLLQNAIDERMSGSKCKRFWEFWERSAR